MEKVKLVGCGTYVLKGERYDAGKVVMVSPAKAEILLGRVSDTGMPFFVRVASASPTLVLDAPARRTRGKAGKAAPAPVLEPSAQMDVFDDESDAELSDELAGGVPI